MRSTIKFMPSILLLEFKPRPGLGFGCFIFLTRGSSEKSEFQQLPSHMLDGHSRKMFLVTGIIIVYPSEESVVALLGCVVHLAKPVHSLPEMLPNPVALNTGARGSQSEMCPWLGKGSVAQATPSNYLATYQATSIAA